ncbi:hypothetical protein [Candidatus Nitrospira allomarina]|jgi:hypothetical protein|uniref:Uncharacterized protein n=1 Tax=Candidatus Nitrospira allomarina TaxID=3020900 RepID=A0AA96GGI3_9BACT|nr:hypothetical protein [Candidatus Nitrospira allomarina]WNM58473.1 hypothetical protein PP769_01540 [Candidatus Nitrospira allomarina]
MARSIAEHTLSRVCDYLSAMGVELTREVTLRALTLVEAGLASQQEDPLQFVMTRIHDHFALQNPPLPTTAPPITRGSMSFNP